MTTTSATPFNLVLDIETATRMISNTDEPFVRGEIFLDSTRVRFIRSFSGIASIQMMLFRGLIGCGVADRRLGGDGATARADHMIHLEPNPTTLNTDSFAVPKICISRRFLAEIEKVEDTSLLYFFVVMGPNRGDQGPQAKLVVKYTWRDAVLTMLHEVRLGHHTYFCGATLPLYGPRYFNPRIRRQDWELVPVD